jgi:hypothetical protein
MWRSGQEAGGVGPEIGHLRMMGQDGTGRGKSVHGHGLADDKESEQMRNRCRVLHIGTLAVV